MSEYYTSYLCISEDFTLETPLDGFDTAREERRGNCSRNVLNDKAKFVFQRYRALSFNTDISPFLLLVVIKFSVASDPFSFSVYCLSQSSKCWATHTNYSNFRSNTSTSKLSTRILHLAELAHILLGAAKNKPLLIQMRAKATTTWTLILSGILCNPAMSEGPFTRTNHGWPFSSDIRPSNCRDETTSTAGYDATSPRSRPFSWRLKGDLSSC